MASFYNDYLSYLDFPQAFPWDEQPKRWQRAMLIISPLYRIHKDMNEAQTRERGGCPFADS